MASHIPSKRSFTGHHTLLPSAQSHVVELEIPIVPSASFLSWTFGRGTVFWRIWPAVLLHTAFAAVIVSVSLKTKYDMSVPSVLLTVLGVVIGFVISYRASSGYDRYWMGRSSWSDLMRNVRTLSRLVWFHVPVRVSPKTADELAKAEIKREEREVNMVMAEKRMALDLIEGFVVATKHHLRGEMGIYYEDLYHLIRPLHDHAHPVHKHHDQNPDLSSPATVRPPLPGDHHGPSTSNSHSHSHSNSRTSLVTTSTATGSSSALQVPSANTPSTPTNNLAFPDPAIPSINAYGTFNTSSSQTVSQSRSSSRSSRSSEHRPLLPGNLRRSRTIMGRISGELIPFESFFSAIGRFFRRRFGHADEVGGVDRNWSSHSQLRKLSHEKHRPRVAGGGQNLPLEILRCLSEWVSVLEDRNVVAGNPMAGMYGVLQSFEDNLVACERVLTTPLPFVYSVHISTVWIYLFFLPFQLIDQFDWYTIPGVAVAAFIYLGFLAAGEEIEQPFGYDENDLDLDMFCQEIVHVDIDMLKRTQAHNSPLPVHHGHNRVSIAEAANLEAGHLKKGADEAFGVLLE